MFKKSTLKIPATFITFLFYFQMKLKNEQNIDVNTNSNVTHKLAQASQRNHAMIKSMSLVIIIKLRHYCAIKKILLFYL